ATAFDSFERVTSQQRSGPGGSLSETLSYEDKLGQWVLGQLKTLKAAGLTPLENRYDSQARLVEVLKYGISQGSSGYNSDGTLAWRADGAGRRTNFSSYRRGLPQGISYPDGGSESAAVNNLGLITSLTDAAGYTTGYGYDSAGRLASITPPGGWTPTTLAFERVSSAEYGIPAGHWRQTISQGNARTIAYYDGFWRPLMTRAFDTTQEASSRKVVVKGYDSAGQLAFESYPQRDASTVGITSPGRRMT
ncbi:RHS repeat protein, partial [Mitsuaria sp. WAJ17]